MKKFLIVAISFVSLFAAGIASAEDGIVSDFVYIVKDSEAETTMLAQRRTMALKATTKQIWVVGFINTGVTTNLDGVSHRQFMGYTRANFDASRWTIVYKYGTGFDQTQYVIAPHEETVNVSPLTIGSQTYEYCYRTIFYLPTSLSSAYAVAFATPPPEDTGATSYKNDGKVYTRRGTMTQCDYVMTDYDSSETEYYKVNTTTTLAATGTVGNITYINMTDVTPMAEETEGGYIVQSDAKFKNVSITGTITYQGQNLMTNIAAMVEDATQRSGGGVWDSVLQVYWTPKMENGSLTYYATTNVNINTAN